MKKQKLLICSAKQFGGLTDTVKYCEHIRDLFEVTYLGWDYGKEKLGLEGVDIVHVSRSGNIISRNLRFILSINKYLKGDFDVVFLHYFKGASMLKLLNWRKTFILDIRTLSVERGAFKRRINDLILKMECSLFQNISVISDGVAKLLGLKRYFVLPLGADIVDVQKRDTNTIRLIYVGTLQNRNIIQCVMGFEAYIRENGDKSARFTIVGDSPEGELENIERYIRESGLIDQVRCLGRISHKEIYRYLNDANIGVSFIPLTKYFHFQPPTKTFEYLLCGLPVIGTKTYENVKILQEHSDCILIEDNELEFKRALEMMRKKLLDVNNQTLAEYCRKYSWESIVTRFYLPMIEHVLEFRANEKNHVY